MSEFKKDEVERLVKDLLNFDPLTEIPERKQPDLVEREASKEVQNAPNGQLLLDEHGHTMGMKQIAVQPVVRALTAWRTRRHSVTFELAQASESIRIAFQYEGEKQKLLDQKQAEDSAALEQHKSSGKYRELEEARTRTAERYDRFLAENQGKIPTSYPVTLYVAALFGVGVSEWFINYPTFREAYVPFVAGAATFLVAAVFAAASHFHGQFLRQRLRMFGDFLQKRERRNNMLFLVFVTVFLAGALFLVGYERYEFIQKQYGLTTGLTAGRDLLGADGGGDPIISRVIQTVALNLFVWFVGCILSYLFHDPIPGFKEALRDRERALEAFQKFNRPLEEQLKQIKAKFDDELRKIEGRMKAQGSALKEIDILIEKLDHAELGLIDRAVHEIDASLSSYRNSLVHVASHMRPQMTFGTQKLPIDQFQTQRMRLPKSEIEIFMNPNRMQ